VLSSNPWKKSFLKKYRQAYHRNPGFINILMKTDIYYMWGRQRISEKG
jgi:hypothetical protein